MFLTSDVASTAITVDESNRGRLPIRSNEFSTSEYLSFQQRALWTFSGRHTTIAQME